MKKILIKAIIAIVLGILMTKESRAGFGAGILICVLMYSVVSWFGMIYSRLVGFGGVLRCIISLVGSGVIYMVPMMILEAILPDGLIRNILTGIGAITLFLIPFVRDWKGLKEERI